MNGCLANLNLLSKNIAKYVSAQSNKNQSANLSISQLYSEVKIIVALADARSHSPIKTPYLRADDLHVEMSEAGRDGHGHFAESVNIDGRAAEKVEQRSIFHEFRN